MEVLERWSGWLGALLAVVVLVAVWQILWEDDRLEERDIRGRTPLIVAAEEGHVEKVRNLVGKGARIDA
ncbi:MAG: ankyrin repeat domain-containing protein, partial [Pseudomonadota bacterium]